MNFVVGTKSKRKIETVTKLLAQIFKNTDFKLIPFEANSNVTETPWDKEIYEGARNRALDSRNNMPQEDFYIGIESGLAKRYGHVYEEAWACIINKDGKEYFGYSSGLKVPDYILKKMEEYKLPHYLIFAKLNSHFDKEINSDTWGLYSSKMLLREISIEESLRNALTQIFAPKESYYHK